MDKLKLVSWIFLIGIPIGLLINRWLGFLMAVGLAVTWVYGHFIRKKNEK